MAFDPLVVAALYVEKDGVYFDLPGVDPWDEKRDARLYDGPYPVVAHPPCASWSIMGNCRPETRARGDEGTFRAALDAVRMFGGVLEQPRYSRAWSEYGLPYPSNYGWTQSLDDPGFTTEVDQGNYGLSIHKPTWLYYVGPDPPELRWGKSGKRISRGRLIGGGGKPGRARVDFGRTPPAFANVLLKMACSAASAFACVVDESAGLKEETQQ